MEKIIINGRNRLGGKVHISGSKNSCLAILAATILFDEPIKLENIPNVRDVTYMISLLLELGAEIKYDGLDIDKDANARSIIIDNKNLKPNSIEYDFVKQMRASIFTLGPLLGRFGKAKVSLPGGCAIGVRPVDMHIEALKKLGANIEIEHGYIVAEAKKLVCTEINLPFPSVGATHNIVMAAIFADGETVINNAARDPEVVALCDFLNSAGAKISGQGTSTITINGVSKLNSTNFMIPNDRLEAATYAIAAAITDGEIILLDSDLSFLGSVEKEFKQIGIDCKKVGNDVICKKGREFSPCDFSTGPFPQFSTDMQAQTMIPLLLANGKSTVDENVFENRFMHVAELKRMGANIEMLDKKSVLITGIKKLSGANVMATDLRASVCLVLAGLVADGTTEVERIYHLDRGYENLCSKLSMCGADIKREII